MSTATPPTHLLTVRDVADLWQTSTDTVRRSIRRGDLSATRLPGRLIRIHPDDLARATGRTEGRDA